MAVCVLAPVWSSLLSLMFHLCFVWILSIWTGPPLRAVVHSSVCWWVVLAWCCWRELCFCNFSKLDLCWWKWLSRPVPLNWISISTLLRQQPKKSQESVLTTLICPRRSVRCSLTDNFCHLADIANPCLPTNLRTLLHYYICCLATQHHYSLYIRDVTLKQFSFEATEITMLFISNLNWYFVNNTVSWPYLCSQTLKLLTSSYYFDLVMLRFRKLDTLLSEISFLHLNTITAKCG